MEKAVSHFEKNLLKVASFIILVLLLGFSVFSYFYLLDPLGDIQFIAMFQKESSAYPRRLLSAEKIIAGQDKRSSAKEIDPAVVPDIFGSRKGVEEEVIPEISNSLLDLGLAVNGQGQFASAGFRDTLGYSIFYKNMSEQNLEGLVIKINFDSTSRNNKMLLDWTTLVDQNGGKIVGVQLSPELRRGTITWTSREISRLAKLLPGEEGKIDFTINLKPFSEVAAWEITDFRIISLASASFSGAETQGGELSVAEANQVAIEVKIRPEDRGTSGTP